MNEKAQSPAEFIIVIFVFIIILVTIFTGFLIRIHPEIEKAKVQTACLNANGLATALLKETGSPWDWTSDPEIFGLTNGTDDFVSYNKWLAAESMGYVNIKNRTVPDASYLISYKIYAFSPVQTDTCAAGINNTVICRHNRTKLTINASAGPTATLNLKLLIPFSSAQVTGATSLESNDIVTITTNANETIADIELHTSPTDSDKFNITLSGVPNLIFIQRADYKTPGDADLQIFVGNTSVKESFGSVSTGANDYCEAERAVNLAGNSETFPARFDILAW